MRAWIHCTLIATNGRRFDTTGFSASGVVRHRIDALLRQFVRLGGDARHRQHQSSTLRSRCRSPATRASRSPGPQQPVWTIDATAKGDLDKLAFAGAFTTPVSRRLHRRGARPHQPTGTGRARRRCTTSTCAPGAEAMRWAASRERWRCAEIRSGFSGRGPLTPAGLERARSTPCSKGRTQHASSRPIASS